MVEAEAEAEGELEVALPEPWSLRAEAALVLALPSGLPGVSLVRIAKLWQVAGLANPTFRCQKNLAGKTKVRAQAQRGQSPPSQASQQPRSASGMDEAEKASAQIFHRNPLHSSGQVVEAALSSEGIQRAEKSIQILQLLK